MASNGPGNRLPLFRRAGTWLAGPAGERRPLGLPLALFACLSLLSLALWTLEVERERDKVRHLTDVLAQRLALRVERTMGERLDALVPIRLAVLREVRGVGESRDIFRRQAEATQAQYPSLHMIGWVDGQGVCRAISSSRDGDALVGQNLTGVAPWSALLPPAFSSGRAKALAEPVHLSVVLPITPLDPAGSSPGAVIACLGMATLLDRSMDAESRRNLVARLEGDSRAPDGGAGDVEARTPISFLGLTWQLHVRPTKELVDRTMGHSADSVLWGGLLASALIAFAVYQAMAYRASHARRTQRHLRSLESLSELSAAISGQLASGTEVLSQLAEAARQLLKMDRAGVCIVHSDTQVLEILATAGEMPATYPRYFPLEKTPAIRHCLQANQAMFVEDVSKMEIPVSAQAVAMFQAGSFILLPLHLPQQAGLMTLARNRPGPLTSLDRRLAQLLGAQGAVILANNRLYQEMSEAIRTRDLLLRELNHRVKNNLAGIVGLLSVGRPDLPAAAEAWLARVTGRIGTMAGAHELLVGGMRRVGLRELLDQVLSSVAVVRPSTINVAIEAPPADISLSADQAVHLVIVLHELCYNALVHGLSGFDGTGTLTLRARRIDGRRLAIDVMDNGRGRASEAPSEASGISRSSTLPESNGPNQTSQRSQRSQRKASSGLGLELVRGLVNRELRGQFSLSPGPGGGTTASVDFPLDGEQRQDEHDEPEHRSGSESHEARLDRGR